MPAFPRRSRCSEAPGAAEQRDLRGNAGIVRLVLSYIRARNRTFELWSADCVHGCECRGICSLFFTCGTEEKLEFYPSGTWFRYLLRFVAESEPSSADRWQHLDDRRDCVRYLEDALVSRAAFFRSSCGVDLPRLLALQIG